MLDKKPNALLAVGCARCAGWCRRCALLFGHELLFSLGSACRRVGGGRSRQDQPAARVPEAPACPWGRIGPPHRDFILQWPARGSRLPADNRNLPRWSARSEMPASTGAERPDGLSASSLGPNLRQGYRIDNEAILNIAAPHPLVGLVDLLDRDHLDVRNAPVLGAAVEHLLRFLSKCLGHRRRSSRTGVRDSHTWWRIGMSSRPAPTPGGPKQRLALEDNHGRNCRCGSRLRSTPVRQAIRHRSVPARYPCVRARRGHSGRGRPSSRFLRWPHNRPARPGRPARP